MELVYINLTSRPDRNENFTNYFNKYFTLHRFAGLTININPIINCGLSHYMAFKSFIGSNSFVIIAEDDSIPIENFTLLFQPMYKWLQENLDKWDYVNLSSSTVCCFGFSQISLQQQFSIDLNTVFKNNLPEYSGLYMTEMCSSGNFLIYNKSCLQYFEQYVDMIASKEYLLIDNDLCHIDYFFGNSKYIPHLKRIISYPCLCVQENGFSNISQANIEYNHLFNRSENEIRLYLSSILRSYITVELRGGLGNQLFQIYATIALAKQYNKIPIFEAKDISSDYPDTKRETYYKSLFKNLVLYDSEFNDRFKWVVINENEHNIINNSNIKLVGYFQNHNIFSNHNEYIESVIKMKSNYTHYLQTYKKENIIAVHFRIGDYQFKQNDHPLLPIEYYKNALNLIENVKEKTILAFCELSDIKQVTNMLQKLELPFELINANLVDYEQMLLMSIFDDIIIANSTFSWWSIYFATIFFKPKCVCLPEKWFNSSVSKNLIYSETIWNIVKF